MRRKSNLSLNWPVVIAVAVLCGISMTLFFIAHGRDAKHNPAVADTVPVQPSGDVGDSALTSDLLYYDQLADEYIALLPADKQLVARLVDSLNHRIVYFESSDHPSCYAFDLESLTTAVLFGGENGFYCGTKLLIVGTIRDWLRVGDNVYFIADNRAPESAEHNAVHVFSINLADNSLHYIDTGFEAVFRDGNRLVVGEAKFLYYSLFTGESVYDEMPVTFQLGED